MAKSMKVFNIATGYCHKIQGQPIPKGAFYGRDKVSYWYCIHKELYPLATPTLEIYRLNPEDGEWYMLIEHSSLVQLIVDRATQSDWDMPIEYPRFTGIHNMSNNMDKVNRKTKVHKSHSTPNTDMIPLDAWESVAPMSYAEKNGSKRIKRPNWSSTQYTKASKPYYVSIFDR